jgi:hypothetical protein
MGLFRLSILEKTFQKTVRKIKAAQAGKNICKTSEKGVVSI